MSITGITWGSVPALGEYLSAMYCHSVLPSSPAFKMIEDQRWQNPCAGAELNSMKTKIVSFIFMLAAMALPAQQNHFAAANNVTWHSLGTNENDSMPLGNGNVALNVWTEQNGDIVLLLAKSDAWSENGQLLKPGRVRVSLTPNPFTSTNPFTQMLKLETGEVQIQSGKN